MTPYLDDPLDPALTGLTAVRQFSGTHQHLSCFGSASMETLGGMSSPARAFRLSALLVATGLAYTWSLSISGFANTFYAAAAQAGAESWKAWFFGSLDASNAITVDKPPASLWLMGLSIRIFGLSSWSLLVPEALMGVATVALVYAFVRRISGEWPALAAGALTALTPSAALMFRYDNPDALLALLVVGAGYAMLRSLEHAQTRWLLLAGTLLGFGFLTKMLQAWLVLPAFILAYLVLAPTPIRRRFVQLLAAFGAMVVSAGWWVAIVSLVPASDRPYVDGTTNNSVMQLVFGYNGLGRLTGHEVGGHGNAGFSSAPGPLRLFEGISGGMVGWLLPAALLLLVVALVRSGPGQTRNALAISGGSLFCTGLVFSFMHGIYHDYYTIALAPWIAMTAAIAGTELWLQRSSKVALATLALASAGSTAWAIHLLGQSHHQPYNELRWIVAVAGLATTVLILLPRLSRPLVPVFAMAGLVATLTGPAAYSYNAIETPHHGAIPQAGPLHVSRFSPEGAVLSTDIETPQPATPPLVPVQPVPPAVPVAQLHHHGSIMSGSNVGPRLISLLRRGQHGFRWSAAAVGSQNAAAYMLKSGTRVIALGGFNGTAPSVTLPQFQQLVASGQVHYFLLTGTKFLRTRGREGNHSDVADIATWVLEHFKAHRFGTTEVFNLVPQENVA